MTDTDTTRKETLFSLSGDVLALDAILEEGGGEITPEVEAWIAEYRDKFTDKVDSVGWYWRTCEARAAGFKKAADDLAAKARTEEQKRDRLKQYVEGCLRHLDTRKISGQVYSFSLQTNGGSPPLRLLVDDPAAFPESCQRVTVTVDRTAVRTALEASTLPEGLAMIEPAGESVRLR